MAGLGPAIHDFADRAIDVDGRHKGGHDEMRQGTSLAPAHDAQILTYLRASRIRVGLILNFHARLLKNGLRRFIV
jgi:hypothetical protein